MYAEMGENLAKKFYAFAIWLSLPVEFCRSLCDSSS